MSQARVAFSTTAISSRSAADQACERIVGVLNSILAFRVSLVTADFGLALQVLEDSSEHRPRREGGGRRC